MITYRLDIAFVGKDESFILDCKNEDEAAEVADGLSAAFKEQRTVKISTFRGSETAYSVYLIPANVLYWSLAEFKDKKFTRRISFQDAPIEFF